MEPKSTETQKWHRAVCHLLLTEKAHIVEDVKKYQAEISILPLPLYTFRAQKNSTLKMQLTLHHLRYVLFGI